MTIHLSKKVLLILAGLITVVGTVGVVSALNYNNQNSSVNTSNQTDSTTKPTGVSTQASTTPTTTTPTPTATANPTTPAVDVNALNAKLCKSIMDNAKAFSDSNNKMYQDGWNSWMTTYADDLDSPEALASKEWTKNYIKKLFSDNIASLNPSYTQACGSGGTVADVMYQPNYDMW